jgi:hypothetical protein
MSKKFNLYILLTCLLFSAHAQQQTAEQVTALFPYQKSASVESELTKMDAWSAKDWRSLFKMLDDDSLKLKATYTVDAYVHHANSNAALVPATTQQVVNGLKQVKSFYAKDYLIQMLGALGSEIGIAPLSKYLKDPVFVGPAARALAAIGSDNAKATLSSALLKAAEPQKMYISAALEHMQFKLPEMKSEDKKGRIGLVNFQDPRYLAKVQEQMEQAKDPVSKRNVLSQLEKVTSVAALMETAKYLDDPVLKNQAASIMARMALRDKTLRGRSPREALEKALPLISGTDSISLNKLLKNYLRALPYDEVITAVVMSDQERKQGFEVLFDGTNLDKWIGNKKGYAIEDSVIVTHPELGGGNLYTAEEYSDFEYRFEFQLTPGANNGLGIRTPTEGDAAYEGMELQILDNESPIYEKLKPYQYHGSVYGVIPAKRGYLKRTGEWNEQTVVVKGSKVKVILNGQVILDGDIMEASKNGTADGRNHPGLMNAKGHIGFLGHGDVVRFRNIRIKKI